ncbi:lipoate--protein ligase family protein [Agrilactobacillus yilanensis]|uniref:Lipoate--protein ligase family protein n=1 Tax=Agrilactobacillus yilanensis TaxID=2485997 RepID=A0ABW4J3R8_9LACO|nr:lipoate--protein ligase family protein [Agrilactobacillus yilanensis]
MQELAQIYPTTSFLVADKHYTPSHNLESFADTNAILRYSDTFDQPLIHFWTLEDSIILGMMDTKLPYFSEALQVLNQQQKHYFIRNSGGLAVASDAGILNVSLCLPNYKDAGIDAAYNQMVTWVQRAFPNAPQPIEAYEITRSYCPGTYDLSIAGQKFGGISQRRAQNGVIIMLYLSVNGDQHGRSQLLKDFYTTGLKDATTKWTFPDIDPSSMANLETLLQQPLTLTDVKQQLLSVFEQNQLLNTTADFTTLAQEPEYQAYFQQFLTNLQQRNQRDLPHL